MLYNVLIQRIRTIYRYAVHDGTRDSTADSTRGITRERTIIVSASTVSAEPAKPAKLGSRGSAESRKWWTLAAVSLAAFMTYLDMNATVLT